MSQALVACLAIALGVDPGVDNEAARDKEALAPLQTYVGGWRGVGQPKRGSSAGAWTEEFEWLWRFKQGRAELVAQRPAELRGGVPLHSPCRRRVLPWARKAGDDSVAACLAALPRATQIRQCGDAWKARLGAFYGEVHG